MNIVSRNTFNNVADAGVQSSMSVAVLNTKMKHKKNKQISHLFGLTAQTYMSANILDYL